MAVAIQRDRNVGVAHESLQCLGVDPGGDHQGGEGMAALVQRNALKPGIPPGPISALRQLRGIERSLAGHEAKDRSGPL
jgi:hypothetical protein